MQRFKRRGSFMVSGLGAARSLACAPAVFALLVASTAAASKTMKAGQEYIDECAAAGVPTPPTWNYEDAFHNRNGTQWIRQPGVVENSFIGAPEQTAEVFYYPSTSPLGVCIALPRSVFPPGQVPEDGPPLRIELLGVICQGSATGEACFYDASPILFPNDTMRFGLGDPEEFFIGGADLLGKRGGICTKCHLGENVFIMHPKVDAMENPINSPLGFGIPNSMSSSFVNARIVDDVTWPENVGPKSLFPPTQTDGCLACHNEAARADPMFGGRFPEVSDQTPDYCKAILGASLGAVAGVSPTMPLVGKPGGFASLTALLDACDKPPTQASPAEKMMSMEAPSDNLWLSDSGTLSYVSGNQTEGQFALSVNASGYVRLDSFPFPSWTLPFIGTTLDLDVFVPPSGQPNQYWLGAVQLYVTIPSAGLYNAYISQVELTPQGTGWRAAAFPLPGAVHAALAAQHNDVSFGIAVNTPSGAPPVLLDNLRFGGTLSMGASAPPMGDVKFNFERGGVWSGRDGDVVFADNSADVGGFNSAMSLRVDLDGFSEGRVWTVPLASPPAGATVTFRVYVPSDAPLVSLTPYMMDSNWQWTDSWNPNLLRDAWVTVTAVVPANAALPLNQLGVKFYLNAPYEGPIYIDAVEW